MLVMMRMKMNYNKASMALSKAFVRVLSRKNLSRVNR